jgi:uncharacterized protein YchJ
MTVREFTQWKHLASGVCLVVGLLLSGCGGAPDWVKEGSGVLNKDDSKSIYGVGTVEKVPMESVAWEIAENRARAEVAKSFETYTAYLMRDYVATTAATESPGVSAEQDVQRAIKTFTAVTLNGVRQIERYKDEEKDMYYVLAKLSFKDMQEALNQAKELDKEVKNFVKKNGERIFDRLEQEEAKRQVSAPGE